MRPNTPTLTEQELEIMKVVWKLETATVRQVYETLLERRRIAYTTVMTMMNILEQKGYLKKEQGERAFVYQPAQPQKQVIRSMVREFVNRVFNGSAEPLLVHLVEDRCLTESDLEEIRRTIQTSRKVQRRQK
jgi:BlaI family penicillinase repressor